MKHLITVAVLLLLTRLVVAAQTLTGDYAIKNVHTGKYVRIKDANSADGSLTLEELPLTGQNTQQYELIAAGSGQYWIRVKGTQLYLSPADPKGATNSAIILQPKQSGDLQLWTLVEQHPTM